MTGISNLGQALDQISRLKNQQITLDTFSTQIASGKKTQQFSGLGADIMRSQRARADLQAIDQYSTNIANAQRRIEVMTGAIKQISDQAGALSTALTVSANGGDAPNLETTQKLATDVYDFIINLVNTMDGERYLFAGSDSGVKPLDDQGQYNTFLGQFVPDETDITNPPLISSGLFGQWGDGTITTDEFIESYSNVNEHILGYSQSLVSGSTGDVRVRVDKNSDFDYTVLGNDPAIKELLTAVGVLKNLPPPEYAPGALNDPTATNAGADIPPYPSEEKQANFYAVVQDLAQKISQALDGLETIEYKLSLVDRQTAIIQEQYTYDKNALQNIIGNVEDIDLTETVAKLQQVQIGLEASFSVTAMISDLTLVNFLSR